MVQGGGWATATEIKVAAALLNMNICVYLKFSSTQSRAQDNGFHIQHFTSGEIYVPVDAINILLNNNHFQRLHERKNRHLQPNTCTNTEILEEVST
jgi:hypothetical protein